MVNVQDIREEIVEKLNTRCGCGLTTDLITKPTFLCLNNGQASISFRAKFARTLSSSPLDLQDYLENWLNGTMSSIVVRSIEHNIGAFCTAILKSDTDQEMCSYPQFITQTTTDLASTSDTSSIIIIVGGAAGVLTVLILAVVCGVVVCVIICARTKHPSDNLR